MRRKVPFLLLGIIIIILMVATVIEKTKGTEFVDKEIYHSFFFVSIWGLLAVSGTILLIKQKVYYRLSIFFLHLSFIIILLGACVTWIWGEQGTIHLRQGEWNSHFINKEGKSIHFPFQIKLTDFRIAYNNGEFAPSDFISHVTVKDKNAIINGNISMNHIFSLKDYRLYQSGYDDDLKGSTLSVSHDKWGISVSYTGYALLFLSMLSVLIKKRESWRKLFNHPLLKKATLCLLLFSFGQSGFSENIPRTLPVDVAEEFGNLYVQYNSRICPLQTLAKDFTMKLYGKAQYKGLSPEQVLTGWIFFYTDWKDEPMIKIKGRKAQDLIGTTDKYVSLSKIQKAYSHQGVEETLLSLHKKSDINNKDLEEMEEKINIISTLYAGEFLKIFPIKEKSSTKINWYSQGEDLPESLSEEQWVFIRKFPDYLYEKIAQKRFKDTSLLFFKLREYQMKVAGKNLPDNNHFKAEKLYNKLDYSLRIGIISILADIALFLYLTHCLIKRKQCKKWIVYSSNALLLFFLTYMICCLCLRGYVSGHLPLATGYETMQFLALCLFFLTFLMQRKFQLILSFGFLMGGLALIVSHLGQSNPQITPLMPVLFSPLLSFHVVIIMIAYSLLSFLMLNGLTAIGLKFFQKDWQDSVKKLYLLSLIILYPAIFCLTTGIFIGAIWANITWGRYWGWDPKEVWALITLLVYTLALHRDSIPLFRRPVFFHLYMIAAFTCVLITYFGVNFILGGMHSYAN